jgi:succinate-semialdehyde dehydrogenase/glutarate-semialdehyde dehydrogenase
MPAANIDLAVRTAFTARVQNTGHSCIASKRFIVHADVYDTGADGVFAGMMAL